MNEEIAILKSYLLTMQTGSPQQKALSKCLHALQKYEQAKEITFQPVEIESKVKSAIIWENIMPFSCELKEIAYRLDAGTFKESLSAIEDRKIFEGAFEQMAINFANQLIAHKDNIIDYWVDGGPYEYTLHARLLMGEKEN